MYNYYNNLRDEVGFKCTNTKNILHDEVGFKWTNTKTSCMMRSDSNVLIPKRFMYKY